MRKLGLLALLALLAAPLKADVLSFNQFGGLNSDDSPLLLQNGQTPDAENVVTDDGPGVQSRKGFVVFSTEPANALWEFPVSNGTRYMIRAYTDGKLKATTGTGAFTITVSTIPTDRVTAGAVLGDRFYFASTSDGLKYWDTASVVIASSSLTVDKLVTHKGRLWASGKSGAQRVIYGSKYLDGTSWTAPTNPSDDDAVIITVTGALDENIQALYSSFQDKLIWFKKNSFGGIFGSRRSNFTQRTFSDTIGVASVDSIRDCADHLRWLGPDRKIWEFDGNVITKISEDVDNIMATVTQGDTNSRSNTQTSAADFTAGTITPTDYLSTTIQPGSIVLSTAVAISSFVDTVSTEFTAGTLTNLSLYPGLDAIQLSTSSLVQKEGCTAATGSVFENITASGFYRSFTSSATYNLGALYVNACVLTTGGGVSPEPIYYGIYTDSSFTPGSLIGNSTGTVITACASGSDDALAYFFPPVPIVSGTRYWIKSTAVATGLQLRGNTSCDPAEKRTNGAGFAAPGGLRYATYQLAYSTFGSIVSRTYDVGFTTGAWIWNWANLAATSTLTSTTTITYQTQTSADGVTFDSLVNVTTGTAPQSTVRRFIRYKANFLSGNSTTTAILSDLTLSMTQRVRPSAYWISQPISIGSAISAWGPFTASFSNGSGSVALAVATSASAGSFTTYYAITNGVTPSISTAPYFSIRSTFTVTIATSVPSLDDVTINWIEGSAVRSASTFFNQRYLLSLALSSTNNNRIMVYNKKNQWHRYSGIVADTLGIYSSRLYFGNTNGIFQMETGYSDNSSAITAYFQTPTFAPNKLDLYSHFDWLYITTDASDSTVVTTNQIDGIPTDYSMGSVQMNATTGIQNFKLPFASSEIQTGKYISLKWSVAGTTFWRINNANLYFQPLPTPE